MFEVGVLNRLPFAVTFEVRLCEVSSTLLECDIVPIPQQRPPGDRSDWMHRTDTRATAGVKDGVRTLVRVIALHIDKRQFYRPAVWMMTIFQYDQKPAPSFVEAFRLVDTVTRFNTRSDVLLRARGSRHHEEQTKQQKSDHYAFAVLS